MKEEFGTGIKFTLPLYSENEDVSSSESEDEVVQPREINLLYAGETNTERQARRDKENGVADGREAVDSYWLQKQVKTFFASDDTGLGLSLAELCSTIVDVLTSSRSDDELQNELFELLGFDRFEFIQLLLENRKSEEERQLQKQIRREEKRLNKKDTKKTDAVDVKAMAFDPQEMRMMREAALRNAKSKPILSSRSIQPRMQEKYPFVFDQYEEARHSSAYVSGTKLVLPDGFERKDDKTYEEINIPPSDPAPTNIGRERVAVASLDEIARLAFKGTKSLNRIQSVVFETAYTSNENLLICAPTGAGKTNIAMLAILHELRQHLAQGVIKKDEFKIVYVAPMKALAAEMVRNFGGRLEPLGITVRELTGDMSLTKQEILKTQMLVTTPEKWDVVTRKSTGDVALAQLVERSQSMIRIVGLSATLPNYLDVARFLNVNPYSGLFFFDGRFRPVPLGQTFIGIKATNKVYQLRDMNNVCYDKVLKQVKAGKQVMVFVHARNETVRTAMLFRDMAKNNGHIEFFLPKQCPQYGEAEKTGTQLYDAKRGAFVDLGILDVMQIFGRAGRPQYDTFGHGTIITSHDKLSHYLSLMTRQNPIESQFINSLTDNLNAEGRRLAEFWGLAPFELPLGTVTNIEEAVKWLSYTYLYVRMRINPLVYGNTLRFSGDRLKYAMIFDRVVNRGMDCLFQDDPTLEKHRYDLIVSAGRKLDKARMARFEERTGFMYSTDLGRIASHFYIKYDTVEVINEKFASLMTEGDIFSLVSNAQEFDQIKVREDEMEELERLVDDGCEMLVPGGKENTHGKVNILLQSYVSRVSVDAFSLVSDMAYVAQCVRDACDSWLAGHWRADCWSSAKTIDKRLWGFEHPLRQFPILSPEVLNKLEARRLTVDRLREMDPKEIGHMVHHIKMGPVIKRCVNQLPILELDATIQPITRTVLRVRLEIKPEFKWDEKVGCMEQLNHSGFGVEDPENNHIYHSEYFMLHKKQALSGEPQTVVFTIPIFEPLPTQYYVRAVSDRWIELLNLQPLPVTALNDSRLESLYSFTHFNPVQTQIFHTLYHHDTNVLLGAPTGSGKTVAAELAIFRVFREYPKFKAVYIAPLKALVRERMEDWKVRIEQKLGKKVVELTGDVTPDMRAVANADLIVTTPEKWDGISRSWQTRSYVKAVALLVIDEIHLLGDERGPVLEVIVSRTNFISSHTSKKVRVVGLSTALANARDLADWLGIKEKVKNQS
nr:hypothetical protein BaRGS_029516 [Batillaria attramentaria]